MHDVSRGMALEKYMISASRWSECPYPEAIELAEKCAAEGYPTGMAVDPDGKWYVLMSGQGPFVAWESPDQVH